MPSITTEVCVDLLDFWESIDDEAFCKEAAARGFYILDLNADHLLSLARRDPREALLEIERTLGHDFNGLLTR